MVEGAGTQEQIVVNADPRKDQIEAGLRQAITVLGPLIAVLAQTPEGQKIGLAGLWAWLASGVGVIATVAALIVGQLKTRSIATKAAAMADKLDDNIATTK